MKETVVIVILPQILLLINTIIAVPQKIKGCKCFAKKIIDADNEVKKSVSAKL